MRTPPRNHEVTGRMVLLRRPSRLGSRVKWWLRFLPVLVWLVVLSVVSLVLVGMQQESSNSTADVVRHTSGRAVARKMTVTAHSQDDSRWKHAPDSDDDSESLEEPPLLEYESMDATPTGEDSAADPYIDAATNRLSIFTTNRRKQRKSSQPVPAPDPNGYVAYLPHSGFNNQRFSPAKPPPSPVVIIGSGRSALENALLVAALLNRTLILPPIYLGHSGVISWRESPLLKFAIRQVETTNYNRLFFSDDMEAQLEEYISPNSNVAIIPWSAIFNLSRLPHPVRTVNIADFVDAGILTDAHDVWTVWDRQRYAYRIFDTIPNGHAQFLFDNADNDPSMKRMLHERQLRKDRWLVVNSTRCWNDEQQLVQRHVAGYVHRSKEGVMKTDRANLQSYETSFAATDGNEEVPAGTEISCRKVAPMLHNFLPMAEHTSAYNRTTTGSITCFPMEKATHAINLDAFKNAFPEQGQPKVIFFGSLFGRYRLHRWLPATQQLTLDIEQALIYQNDILTSVADAIVRELGGERMFFAAHVRAGDGSFVKKAKRTIADASAILRDWQEQLQLGRGDNEQNELPLVSTIYIATDHPNPHEASIFEPIRGIFSAVQTITDFPEQISRLSDFDQWRINQLSSPTLDSSWESEMTELLDTMELLRTRQGASGESGEEGNPLDGNNEGSDQDEEETQEQLYGSMSKFLLALKRQKLQRSAITNADAITKEFLKLEDPIDQLSPFARLWVPFVEQLVCSRARGVVGTYSSTFSDYIERMYRHYWRDLPELEQFFAYV